MAFVPSFRSCARRFRPARLAPSLRVQRDQALPGLVHLTPRPNLDARRRSPFRRTARPARSRLRSPSARRGQRWPAKRRSDDLLPPVGSLGWMARRYPVLRVSLSLHPQQRIDPRRRARRPARHPCRAGRLRRRRVSAARWQWPTKSRYPDYFHTDRCSTPRTAETPTRQRNRLARTTGEVGVDWPD